MVTYLLGENPSLGNRSFHHRTHEVNDVIAKPDNVVRSFTNKNGTFQIRESLFAGPDGFLKFESTWQVTQDGLRLTTVIPMGGP